MRSVAVLPRRGGAGSIPADNACRLTRKPWKTSRIVPALLAAGRRVMAFEGDMYLNGLRAFEGMRDLGGPHWGMPAGLKLACFAGVGYLAAL